MELLFLIFNKEESDTLFNCSLKSSVLIRWTQFIYVFLLKLALSNKLCTGLRSTNKSTISFLKLIFIFFLFSHIPQKFLAFSLPLFLGCNVSRFSFLLGNVREVSWSGEMPCLCNLLHVFPRNEYERGY